MRLLLWYWGRRGAGRQLTLALARALARRDDVAVALSLSAQADLAQEFATLGLPTEQVRTYASAAGFVAGFARVPGLARGLVRQSQDFRADAVVSVMTHLWTPLVAPALARAGLRYVPMVHDAEPHPGDAGAFWEWRLGRELDAAREAIVFSDSVAAGVHRRRPALALHRLTLGALLPVEAPPAAARGPGLHFVNLGRMRAYKGLDLLRDAWASFAPRYPGATLLVAGDGDPEALAPGLSALPGVTVQARWLDEAEMASLVAAADAVVLPYREASQSGIAPAAHGLGVPVVVTPVGGLAEQVRDGIDGLVARDMTPAALAEAMATLAAHPMRFAAGARETGRRLADWDAIAAALVAALRASGGQPRRAP
jgi:glycosyltransferase involved in cell wall biosynthesis